MGKRLVRVFNADISKNANSLVGKEADVVLVNKATLHGQVKTVDSTGLEFRDKRGMVHALPMANIVEVIYDLEAPF